jgi:predicted nucleic acid-binding protein
VSSAVASSGALREIVEAWLLERRFVVLSSDQVLDELEAALAKPFFAKKIAPQDRAAHVALVRREAVVVLARTSVRGVAPDPADDAILAAAVDGGTRYLVTGDKPLRALGAFRGVEIVTPRELVDLLGGDLRREPTESR